MAANASTVPVENIPSKRKCQIKSVDMEPSMQEDVVKLVNEAMDKTNVEMEIAREIKMACDMTFPPPWHCVVGRKFGSYVTHESGYFIYMYLGAMAVLLFKSKD